MASDPTTHWDGCEREHHACALAMLDALRAPKASTPTTDLDALVAGLRAMLTALDAPHETNFATGCPPCVTRSRLEERVRADLPALLDACDALRTRLAQAEGERDRLLHDAGNCPDDCALDHEPRTVRGMSCPAGCSARMIPDYVETHLTMCPAVQTALRAVIATLTTQIGEAWLEYEITNNGRRADAAAYEAHRRVCGR